MIAIKILGWEGWYWPYFWGYGDSRTYFRTFSRIM